MRPISSTPRIWGSPRPASPMRLPAGIRWSDVGHLDGLHAPVAELADVLAHRDALESGPRILLHDECGDALVGPGGQGDESRPFAVGDPGLRAVDDVLVSVTGGPTGDVAGVAAGIGLGEGQRPAPFPGGQHGQPALPLLLGAVGHDQGGGHGVGVDDAGQAHPAVGELLDDPDVGEQVEAEAAVRLGDGHPEEPEIAHLPHDLGGEAVGMLHLGGERDDLAWPRSAGRSR